MSDGKKLSTREIVQQQLERKKQQQANNNNPKNKSNGATKSMQSQLTKRPSNTRRKMGS